jgi:hypothetical protein
VHQQLQSLYGRRLDCVCLLFVCLFRFCLFGYCLFRFYLLIVSLFCFLSPSRSFQF